MTDEELQMDSGSGGARINTGSISIIVIFAVLCLTVFAVLSLSTALTEQKLAKRSAESVSAYYAADLVCAERADAILEAMKAGADAADIAQRAEEFGAELVSTNPAVTVLRFAEPVDENQELRVELMLSGGELEIGSWIVADTGDWTPDTTIEVWDGDILF